MCAAGNIRLFNHIHTNSGDASSIYKKLHLIHSSIHPFTHLLHSHRCIISSCPPDAACIFNRVQLRQSLHRVIQQVIPLIFNLSSFTDDGSPWFQPPIKRMIYNAESVRLECGQCLSNVIAWKRVNCGLHNKSQISHHAPHATAQWSS